MKINILIFFIGLSTIIFSCKKGPGEGGKASITGKVWEERYIGAFHDSTHDHWAAEQDIYIVYGDEVSYGNRTKAGPDGLFEFKYLRKGNYTMYVYSDATNILKEAIKKQVDIPKSGTTDVGTFIIKKIN